MCMHRNWQWVFLLAILLGILACNLPSSTPSSLTPGFPPPPTQGTMVPTPTQISFPSTPTLAYQPVFEQAPCAFPVPSGYSPECGYLFVPENRARPDSP